MPAAYLHTLNLRLSADELAYIITHADDRLLIVDASLLPLYDQLRDRAPIEHIVVVNGPSGRTGLDDYEALLAGAAPDTFAPAEPAETDAAALCYTTGTTGRLKGVLYSHRALALHSLGVGMADSLAMRQTDTVMPIVPMFHANAWGFPYAAVMLGAKLVFPGPHLDPASVVELFVNERVTFTGAVPTIWMGLLNLLDANPGAHDLSRLRVMVCGGSAAPASLLDALSTRHGLDLLHAWGMTEMAPVGTVGRLTDAVADASPSERLRYRAKQGRPVPLVEIRARNDEGLVPWDGLTMGELEVRGPWIASAYFNCDDDGDRFTADGWFRTGDIATIDAHGLRRDPGSREGPGQERR